MSENKECYLCESDISNASYFFRIEKGMDSILVEVCPECHHHYRYAPKDMLEQYKKRRNIK